MSRQTFSVEVYDWEKDKATMIKVVVQSKKAYPPDVTRDLALAMASVRAEGTAVVAGMVKK